MTGLLAVAVACVLLAACDRTWIVTYDGGVGPGGTAMVDVVLTSDGTDTYKFERRGRRETGADRRGAPIRRSGDGHRHP